MGRPLRTVARVVPWAVKLTTGWMPRRCDARCGTLTWPLLIEYVVGSGGSCPVSTHALKSLKFCSQRPEGKGLHGHGQDRRHRGSSNQAGQTNTTLFEFELTLNGLVDQPTRTGGVLAPTSKDQDPVSGPLREERVARRLLLPPRDISLPSFRAARSGVRASSESRHEMEIGG